uniref:Uncharacterized protein n=1 Tax=Physcomitrium patens TaxID=3218 RepID=A0A2K1J4D1_PHYPA|nr:hypothetical protein PHYPA_022240 [Physcomitrium patens]
MDYVAGWNLALVDAQQGADVHSSRMKAPHQEIRVDVESPEEHG